MNRSFVPFPPTRRPRRLLLAALILGWGGPGLARAQDEGPVLLSTTGGQGAPAATSLPELQKKAAAGDPRACMQLGVCFEAGDGVKQDYAQARALYEKAAAGGVADAIYRLGKFQQDGLGAAADPAKAHQLYQLAAGFDVPIAQYNLGAMLVSARGVPRDFVEGLAWLILAARHGFAPEGEQRVRAHLADRPQDIAAAERRAQELRREIDARRGTKPPWPPPEVVPDSPRPDVAMPVVEKPKIGRPKMEPPKIAPPPLPLPPPVPPTSGTPPGQ